MRNKFFISIFLLLLFILPKAFSQVPAAPANLQIQYIFSSAISLVWQDNSTNESGFYLERSTDGINFSRIKILPANTDTYPDIGLLTTTKYYYRICSFNAKGNSEYSNITSGVPSFLFYCSVGTDTVSVPYPFYYTASDSRTQMLYLKTEMVGVSCNVGYIWTIGFFYTGSGTATIQNLTVKMKNTTDTVLNRFIDTGFTTVWNNSTFMFFPYGWNNITFMTPFVRDVNKNLLVEVCFDRAVSGISNALVRSSTTHDKVWHNHKNSGAGCLLDSGYAITQRANIQMVNVIDGVRKISENVPSKYSVEQNYPNPFNGDTKFKFKVKEFSPVTLSMYDILGRQEVVIFSEPLAPGEYEKIFSLDSHPLPSGIYYYCFVANGFVSVKKMVVLK